MSHYIFVYQIRNNNFVATGDCRLATDTQFPRSDIHPIFTSPSAIKDQLVVCVRVK